MAAVCLVLSSATQSFLWPTLSWPAAGLGIPGEGEGPLVSASRWAFNNNHATWRTNSHLKLWEMERRGHHWRPAALPHTLHLPCLSHFFPGLLDGFSRPCVVPGMLPGWCRVDERCYRSVRARKWMMNNGWLTPRVAVRAREDNMAPRLFLPRLPSN